MRVSVCRGGVEACGEGKCVWEREEEGWRLVVDEGVEGGREERWEKRLLCELCCSFL